ncbi:MAG: helix-turn-helix domain-containing protein [Bacteroidota bacterium]
MGLKTKHQLATHLGKKIKQVRQSKGISLKHFEALEHAIHRHSLSDIEQGKKLPSVYTLYRIAHVLQVRMDELLK